MTPPDSYFEALTWAALRRCPFLRPLQELLLEHGGRHVMLWREHNDEISVERLLSAGRLYAEPVHLLKEPPGRCHQLTARYFSTDPRRFTWLAGFALYENLWVPHSCILDTTTNERLDTYRPKAFFAISSEQFGPFAKTTN